MRKFFYFFSVLISSLFVSSCVEEFDDSAIWDELEGLKTRITALEEKVADNVSALQSMVSLGSIASYDYNAETGKGVITLVDGKTITIDQTMKGYSLITVTRGDDGVWYWAISKDGVSTPLVVNGNKVPVSVTPALKISDENEWLISVDGGVTWINTGIEYGGAPAEDESGDSEKDDSDVTEVVFFKKAEKNGEYLILTLSDDTVIEVAIAGTSEFSAVSETLYFSRVSMRKSVELKMVNVSAYTITEVPEGWKANIEGDYLNVTSPDNFTTFPKSGTIKALAVYENGLPAILSLEVAHEPMVSLKYVNGKVVATLSENTGDDFNGYLLKSWKKTEYTDEAAVAWFNNEAANLTQSVNEVSGEYELAAIIEDLDVDLDYIIVAVPYLPGTMTYEASDIQKISCKSSAGWNFTDIRFDSAMLTAVLEDDEYFGGFTEMAFWTERDCPNIIESLGYGQLTPYTIPSYSGPANGFPDGQISSKINPATEYVVWYLPVKSEGSYTEDDFVLYTFTTPDVAADASIAAPTVNVKDITVAGFSADVTPASGTYRTYAAAVKSTVLPATDVEIVKYLIQSGKYSEGNNVNTVTTGSYSSEDELYLVAVSLSDAGGYGTILKQQVELPEPIFTDNLSVKVDNCESYLGEVTLSVSFTGNPSTITYFAESFVFHSDEQLQQFLALGQYNAITESVSSLGGKITLTGLEIGALYTFYAVVHDSGSNYSKLYKYEFTPTCGIDYVLKTNADYSYGKPQLSGSRKSSGNFYTLTLNVTKPDTCTKYWLFKGSSEYFANDAWSDSDKLVAKQYGEVTEHTTSETGLVYEFMNEDSRIYMVWLDDKGRYHAISEYRP